MITLDSASNEQLLVEIIRRQGLEAAPARLTLNGDWHRCTVELQDADATILIDDDDYRRLMDSEL